MNVQQAATIRPATPDDASLLAELATQLGYPSTTEQVAKRFASLADASAENAVFVAEIHGRVVGWVHVHLYRLLVDDPEAEIGGLVVEASLRGPLVGIRAVGRGSGFVG